MRILPSSRQIDRSKLVDYLLHALNGQGKADVFKSYGFTAANWERLHESLMIHADASPVTGLVATAFGTKYIVTGSLQTPSGRRPEPLIVAVWQQDWGQAGVRLITAYPA